jgi:hypothetical protein
VVLAEANGSKFDQALIGKVIPNTDFLTQTHNLMWVDIDIGREPTQTVYGYAYNFAATQQVNAIDVRLEVRSIEAHNVDIILGARHAKTNGTFWSRMVHTATWGPTPSTLEFRYTPEPPYMTGPISAAAVNDSSFAIEMAFRSSTGGNAQVQAHGFTIRLVYADGTLSNWTPPGTVRNDSIDVGWSDPNRLSAVDDSSASSMNQPNIAGTAMLRSTGYGFAIPPTATISGVELAMAGRISTNADYFLRYAELVANGSVIGVNRATRTVLPKSSLPKVGGATDTWLAPLTATTVNSASFGVEVSFFVEQPSNYGNVFLDGLPLRIWGCN